MTTGLQMFSATHIKNSTHLVEKSDGRLQDLLPLAELRLVELPLELQNLSPLSSRLRQRTEETGGGEVKGDGETYGEKCRAISNAILLQQQFNRLEEANENSAECLPVSNRIRVPRLQCMGRSFQSVQLVKQQHVESH